MHLTLTYPAQSGDRFFTRGNVRGYCFGFNGQMKDDELHGEGNAYAFEYRIHDARLGRFLSVDPLYKEYPWNSTYAFAENRVIDGIDMEGREYSWFMTKMVELFGGKGVGYLEIAGAVDVGVIAAGVRANGSVGIAYDTKGNYAAYGSVGGFADFFGVLGSKISFEGNPKTSGEFVLGGGISVMRSEGYNWGYESVLDLRGNAKQFYIQATLFNIVSAGLALNMNSSNEVVGFAAAGGAGVGTPGEFGIMESTTTLMAFTLQDFAEYVWAKANLDFSIRNERIGGEHFFQNVQTKTIERETTDGYTGIFFQATYKVDGVEKTKEVFSGVEYKTLDDGSTATRRVFNNLKQ